MLVNACDNIVQSVYWSTENHNTLLKVYSSMEHAGMEYCLSIHQIHRKEMYKYWMTDMSIPVTQRWSGDYITWSKVYIKSWDIGRNRILSFHPPDTSERNIQILNDLIWAFRWLNGGLGIILHGQKCISSYQIYAGIEYCLSIHRIHWKEIYKYWMTWYEHSSGSMVVWG